MFNMSKDSKNKLDKLPGKLTQEEIDRVGKRKKKEINNTPTKHAFSGIKIMGKSILDTEEGK